ncbi:MAG: NusG domain II-containing protein [Treponema sp.]|nr:NusG domain II-containing protein [Treponema sp.]
MENEYRIRPFDFVVLLAALAVLTGSFFLARKSAHRGQVLVVRAGKTEYAYSLMENQELHIKGPLGESTILIENGSACFTDSPCTNKVCIHAGKLKKTGDVAACLPNAILLVIEGE